MRKTFVIQTRWNLSGIYSKVFLLLLANKIDFPREYFLELYLKSGVTKWYIEVELILLRFILIFNALNNCIPKNHRFVQRKLTGDHPRSDWQKKKLTLLEERFIQITSRRERFSYSKHALHNVLELSLVREYPPKPPGTISYARGGWSKYWHFGLLKTFYDRHCAQYKSTMHEVFGIK